MVMAEIPWRFQPAGVLAYIRFLETDRMGTRSGLLSTFWQS
jgi:hypothetical protein